MLARASTRGATLHWVTRSNCDKHDGQRKCGKRHQHPGPARCGHITSYGVGHLSPPKHAPPIHRRDIRRHGGLEHAAERAHRPRDLLPSRRRLGPQEVGDRPGRVAELAEVRLRAEEAAQFFTTRKTQKLY